MAGKTEKGLSDTSVAIHQYYMDIINCMPNVVYWIDLNCALKGANNHFVRLLGLNDLHDFNGTPYQLLEKHAHWDKKRVESFKLDDMKVIFSGKAQHRVKEPPIQFFKDTDNTSMILNYLSTRVPLFDKKKEVMGLVVVLEDIAMHETSYLHAPKPVMSEIISPDRAPRILMVEDNMIAQKVEQALLISLGCDVDTAESGESAEKLFEPGKYDVIFMDIGLQDTSGYIVAKKLREKENGSSYHATIIALTSYQADVVKYDCRDYFMDGVITKPLSQDQAQQIIQRYFHHQDVEITDFKSS